MCLRSLCVALLVVVIVPCGASAATALVNSAADPGNGICDAAECTFREAFNGYFNAGVDRIEFAIAGSGPHAITLTSDLMPPLPATSISGLTIDGYTQPGSQPNSAAAASNAVIKVFIDGNGFRGMVLEDSNVVRGLALGGCAGAGITIEGDDNVVSGCFIGTDASGAVARPNTSGILIHDASPMSVPTDQLRNRIGGPAPADRNVISGNAQVGISLNGTLFAPGFFSLAAARDTLIEGNLIGVSASGETALANGFGVDIRLGSTTTLRGNVIAGNSGWGVRLRGELMCCPLQLFAAHDNVITANDIGTSPSGAPLPNGSGGIEVGPYAGAIVGGLSGAEGNRIRFNAGPGVVVANDSFAAILANSIDGNSGLAIDLNADGPTANDPLDTDSGPNDLQNHPVIASVHPAGAGFLAAGTLDSTPSTTLRIELFDGGAPSQLRGSFDVITDSAGHAAFEAPLSGAPSGGLSATATNMVTRATSELSPAIAVSAAAIPLLSPALLAALAAALTLVGAMAAMPRS
jgi:hypothetical protein